MLEWLTRERHRNDGRRRVQAQRQELRGLIVRRTLAHEAGAELEAPAVVELRDLWPVSRCHDLAERAVLSGAPREILRRAAFAVGVRALELRDDAVEIRRVDPGGAEVDDRFVCLGFRDEAVAGLCSRGGLTGSDHEFEHRLGECDLLRERSGSVVTHDEVHVDPDATGCDKRERHDGNGRQDSSTPSD